MENIFENAYFGKVYKTRDGRKAIYNRHFQSVHLLMREDTDVLQPYFDNGKGVNISHEIVSEWTEPIDEEKLTKMANEYMLHPDRTIESYALLTEMMEAFKAGYRKALEK